MKVQRIRYPETDEVSWIVLDDAHLLIEPITAYLAFLESLGRSPHTRRAIAHHLKLFWEFLRDEQMNWREVDIARLAGFISWLRRPASAVLSIAPQEAKRTNATIDQMLASIHGFYDFHMRLGTLRRAASVPISLAYPPPLQALLVRHRQDEADPDSCSQSQTRASPRENIERGRGQSAHCGMFPYPRQIPPHAPLPDGHENRAGTRITSCGYQSGRQ